MRHYLKSDFFRLIITASCGSRITVKVMIPCVDGTMSYRYTMSRNHHLNADGVSRITGRYPRTDCPDCSRLRGNHYHVGLVRRKFCLWYWRLGAITTPPVNFYHFLPLNTLSISVLTDNCEVLQVPVMTPVTLRSVREIINKRRCKLSCSW